MTVENWQRMVVFTLGPVALAAAAIGGCKGDPGTAETDTSTTGTSSSEEGPDLECDVPQMFEERCGSQTCHGGGGASASGLDLISPGVEDRLSGAPGTNCAGILADPSDPEGSLLYTKVSDPQCGVLMPISGEPLDDDELTCLSFWISGLLPPGGGCDDCICEPGEVESCYGGPEGTAGVGQCVAGTHTCQTSGMAWSDCEGEVQPTGEDCLTPEDEDCDGVAAPCGDVWARSFGDEDDDALRGVALDADGNVLSFGDFEGTVSFGGDPLMAVPSDPPKPDLVIAKHDRFGNPLWSRNYGDNSTQIGVKLLVDPASGAMVGLVRMYGGIDMGGGHLQAVGGMEILVFKLDAEGEHVWSLMVGGPDADRAERIAIDSAGDVIVTGTFTDNATFGVANFASAGLRDAFVLKLDGASGDIDFIEVFGGPGDDYGFGVAATAGDDIVIAGRFSETLDIGADALVSAGGRDVFLAELGPDGTPNWARSFGGAGEDEAHDLRVQQNGDIVLLGALSSTVDFGGGPLVSAGSRDIFVASFDAAGTHNWSERFGDAADQFEPDAVNAWMSMRLDDACHIYVGGSLYGTLGFDGGAQLVAAGDSGNPDVFYFELADDGSYEGGRSFGGPGTDHGYDLEVTDTGQVVLVGRFTGSTLDFGTEAPLVNVDRSDAYLAKIDKG